MTKTVYYAIIYPMNEKIVDMYLEGKYSMADVGKAFGVSRQYVHQVLNKSKVEDRWLKYKNKDKADLAKYGEALNELMERYRNGEYINPVVQELKIPSRIVNKFFHRTAEDVLDHEISKYARNLAPQPNGCIEWTGCYANGYPIHPVNSHDRSALKWGWFYANGEFVSVKNTCGNRRCVNIEHMEKRLVG